MAEDGELFIVHWLKVTGDATEMVLCGYCGGVRYSSPENLKAARKRGMLVVCLSCCIDRKSEMVVGGTIRRGKVINRETKE